MKFTLRDSGKIIKKAAKKWYGRDPFRQSAIIAYYAIFSLPGLLVVVLYLAGYFFGADAVNGHLHEQISATMGTETADEVEVMVMKASASKDSVWASIIGFFTIIIGATGVFVQIQKTLNIIWEVKADTEKSGIWTFAKTRLFSFGLILSIGFLLLISLVLSSMITALGKWLEGYWPEYLMFLFEGINFIVSLGIITVLFALMFKFLPDAKIRWRSVWTGAFFTAILFTIGKTALGLYFGQADPASGYGAAGSIILILLWTSYSSMIVFFGAEVTKAYSDHHVGEVAPTKVAKKKENRQA